MLADDPLHGRQTEAGASIDGLGGEEGLEDVPLGLAIHADAVVTDLDLHVRSFGRVEVVRCLLARNVYDLGPQADEGRLCPAVVHGITGVDQYVEEHLLQQTGIADDVNLFLEIGLDGDLAIEGATADTASIFCDWRSCSSSNAFCASISLRSVTSSVNP